MSHLSGHPGRGGLSVSEEHILAHGRSGHAHSQPHPYNPHSHAQAFHYPPPSHHHHTHSGRLPSRDDRIARGLDGSIVRAIEHKSRAPQHRQPVVALSVTGQEAVEVDVGAVGDVSIAVQALIQADEIHTLYPLALGRIKPQVLVTVVAVRVAVPIHLARRMRIAQTPPPVPRQRRRPSTVARSFPLILSMSVKLAHPSLLLLLLLLLLHPLFQ